MHKKIISTAILFLVVVLNGCTNYLYQGAIKAEDSAGKQRQVVLYWSKTDPLIGDEKADMAHLLTECGSLIVFENQPEGVLFRGEPQRDRLVVTSGVSTNSAAAATAAGKTMECGRFVGVTDLKQVGAGKVSLSILCEPVSDEFSVRPRTYIKARKAPYDFTVTADKTWSFLGSTPRVPKVPECADQPGQ